MKIYATLFLASALLCSATYAADNGSVIDLIGPVDYQRSIKSTQKPAIIDVRTDQEYADGHLPNAIRIGIEDKDFAERLGKLPKDQPLYVYCGSGFRSGKSAERAAKMGFKKVIDLEGGIKAWKNAGLPVELDKK